uniref:PorP/SprF family type IX secretion system membrane protein n=1 Tax=Roseihalotalea indica TaxID=2867963 RepID=A0AA49GNR0_9BACT|nr:PorP/SprF family type IX secretion system membrane protein [Tunicatimonas sp. TK19036]
MKVVLNILFLIFMCLTAVGQRMPFFTHHVTNPYIYNPAFAGYDAHPVLYLTHRQQWIGIDGAPASTHLSFHTPAGNANPFSLGGDLTHDQLGIYRYSSFRTSAAYMVPLSAEKEHYVRFGLSAGLGMNGYDLQGVNATDDAIFQAAQNAGAYFDARFGLQYHIEHFNLGISLPHLFTPPSLEEGVSEGGFDQFSRIIGSINYRFKLNPEGKFSIEPTILYHYAKEFDPQLEALALLRFKESFWVGGGYQQQSGIATLLGFKVKNLSFSYHYGLGNPELTAGTMGTHELQLGLVLGKKKATVKRKPRLTTKANSEAIPEAVIEAQKKQDKKKKKQDKKKEETPSRKQVSSSKPATSSKENVKQQPDTANPNTKNDIELPANSENQNSGADQNRSSTTPPESYENHSFEEIKESDNNTITLGEPEPSDVPSEPRFAKAKRKKSNHPLEMNEGVYLIAGTFSQQANAEKLSRQLLSEGYQAKVGYNSDKDYYYVSLMQTDDPEIVRNKISQIRKDPRFSKSWILVIE